MALSACDLDAVVIHLKRSPERLEAFRSRFAGTSLAIEPLDGIDGLALDAPRLVMQGLLDASALEWPKGQLGCACSHIRALSRCLRRKRPLLILEDDAVAPPGWEQQLNALLAQVPSGWEMLLLGWNLDSCLQLEWAPGQTFTSLFQPRFPTELDLSAALSVVQQRQWLRLQKGLGLAGYVVNPEAAARLLEWALPLRTLPIDVPELPQRSCFSLDGQLNQLYPHMSAWAVFPPLVMGINDKPRSQTAA